MPLGDVEPNSAVANEGLEGLRCLPGELVEPLNGWPIVPVPDVPRIRPLVRNTEPPAGRVNPCVPGFEELAKSLIQRRAEVLELWVDEREVGVVGPIHVVVDCCPRTHLKLAREVLVLEKAAHSSWRKSVLEDPEKRAIGLCHSWWWGRRGRERDGARCDLLIQAVTMASEFLRRVPVSARVGWVVVPNVGVAVEAHRYAVIEGARTSFALRLDVVQFESSADEDGAEGTAATRGDEDVFTDLLGPRHPTIVPRLLGPPSDAPMVTAGSRPAYGT